MLEQDKYMYREEGYDDLAVLAFTDEKRERRFWYWGSTTDLNEWFSSKFEPWRDPDLVIEKVILPSIHISNNGEER